MRRDPEMQTQEGLRPTVLLRDLILFHFKLALDGAKGFTVLWLSLFAVFGDLFLVPKRERGKYFYAVLRMSERFDQWLNLYSPAHRAGANQDGLFGESRAGDATFVGRMEEWVRGHKEPETAAR